MGGSVVGRSSGVTKVDAASSFATAGTAGNLATPPGGEDGSAFFGSYSPKFRNDFVVHTSVPSSGGSSSSPTSGEQCTSAHATASLHPKFLRVCTSAGAAPSNSPAPVYNARGLAGVCSGGFSVGNGHRRLYSDEGFFEPSSPVSSTARTPLLRVLASGGSCSISKAAECSSPLRSFASSLDTRPGAADQAYSPAHASNGVCDEVSPTSVDVAVTKSSTPTVSGSGNSGYGSPGGGSPSVNSEYSTTGTSGWSGPNIKFDPELSNLLDTLSTPGRVTQLFNQARCKKILSYLSREHQPAGLRPFQSSVDGEYLLADLEPSPKIVVQDTGPFRETIYEHLVSYINRRCSLVIHTSAFSKPAILRSYFNDLKPFFKDGGRYIFLGGREDATNGWASEMENLREENPNLLYLLVRNPFHGTMHMKNLWTVHKDYDSMGIVVMSANMNLTALGNSYHIKLHESDQIKFLSSESASFSTFNFQTKDADEELKRLEHFFISLSRSGRLVPDSIDARKVMEYSVLGHAIESLLNDPKEKRQRLMDRGFEVLSDSIIEKLAFNPKNQDPVQTLTPRCVGTREVKATKEDEFYEKREFSANIQRKKAMLSGMRIGQEEDILNLRHAFDRYCWRCNRTYPKDDKDRTRADCKSCHHGVLGWDQWFIRPMQGIQQTRREAEIEEETRQVDLRNSGRSEILRLFCGQQIRQGVRYFNGTFDQLGARIVNFVEQCEPGHPQAPTVIFRIESEAWEWLSIQLHKVGVVSNNVSKVATLYLYRFDWANVQEGSPIQLHPHQSPRPEQKFHGDWKALRRPSISEETNRIATATRSPSTPTRSPSRTTVVAPSDPASLNTTLSASVIFPISPRKTVVIGSTTASSRQRMPSSPSGWAAVSELAPVATLAAPAALLELAPEDSTAPITHGQRSSALPNSAPVPRLGMLGRHASITIFPSCKASTSPSASRNTLRKPPVSMSSSAESSTTSPAQTTSNGAVSTTVLHSESSTHPYGASSAAESPSAAPGISCAPVLESTSNEAVGTSVQPPACSSPAAPAASSTYDNASYAPAPETTGNEAVGTTPGGPYSSCTPHSWPKEDDEEDEDGYTPSMRRAWKRVGLHYGRGRGNKAPLPWIKDFLKGKVQEERESLDGQRHHKRLRTER